MIDNTSFGRSIRIKKVRINVKKSKMMNSSENAGTKEGEFILVFVE